MPSSNPQDSSPTPLGDGAFPHVLGECDAEPDFSLVYVNKLQYKHPKSTGNISFTKTHPAGSSCPFLALLSHRCLKAFHHGCESKASSIRLLAVHQGSFDLSNGKNACLTIPKNCTTKKHMCMQLQSTVVIIQDSQFNFSSLAPCPRHPYLPHHLHFQPHLYAF